MSIPPPPDEDDDDQRATQHLVLVETVDPGREKPLALAGFDDAFDWYSRGVGDAESYIDAAFRSSYKNEAYLFMGDEYVLVNYAPGTRDDKVLNGPLRICDGFPSLAGTAFGEYGIDCAFATRSGSGSGSGSGNHAYIFSGNLCAYIDYAPRTKDDKILRGPMTIAQMFPFLKGTVFENGVDAAFENSVPDKAYLFKGDRYANINYGHTPHLMSNRLITQGFTSLKGTIFQNGMDAAFASHKSKEAYLFKRDSYVLFNFAPGTPEDYLIGGGVKPILPNWPSLRNILPRTNRGLDIHDHPTLPLERDQDEF